MRRKFTEYRSCKFLKRTESFKRIELLDMRNTKVGFISDCKYLQHKPPAVWIEAFALDGVLNKKSWGLAAVCLSPILNLVSFSLTELFTSITRESDSPTKDSDLKIHLVCEQYAWN